MKKSPVSTSANVLEKKVPLQYAHKSQGAVNAMKEYSSRAVELVAVKIPLEGGGLLLSDNPHVNLSNVFSG